MALRASKRSLLWTQRTKPIAVLYRAADQNHRLRATYHYKCEHGMLTYHTCTSKRRAEPGCRQFHTDSVLGDRMISDDEITEAFARLDDLLSSESQDVPEIWAMYDQLKIRRLLSFVSFETWTSLLKTCQRTPPRLLGSRRAERHGSPPNKQLSKTYMDAGHKLDDVEALGNGHRRDVRLRTLLPLGQGSASGRLESEFGREFVGDEMRVWTRDMSKRRVLMMLGDMWRCSEPTGIEDTGGFTGGSRDIPIISIWRPVAQHYNIAFDVICRDPASSVDELISLHTDMRLHMVSEDAITFNTLLNGCRRLRAWRHFRAIDEQMRKRHDWGVTRMDATTWGTLIQGYRECEDWESVDRCVALATKACHDWRKDPGVGVEPTVKLWTTIVSVYAQRNMVSQMIGARRVMGKLGLEMSSWAFAAVFAALHHMRRSLARSRKDTWPAVELAIQEFEAMRDGGIVPNATVLTNIILTIGLKNHAQSHKSDGYPDRMQRKLESIGGQVRDELESMAMRGRDPNIYAALLNLSSQSANIHDAEAVWQTLETELRFSQGGSRQPLLNSLTLSAYMHALISCREYEKAISVFYKYVLPMPGGPHGKLRGQLASARLHSVDRSVYEAAIKAFALADRHRLCLQIIQKMTASRIMPSVLTLRYLLLPPDYTDPQKIRLHKYTRRWSLPLSVAREAWDIVLATRRERWLYGSKREEGEMPVIVNDIAAQFIRVAAYGRSVEFGEQVFEALKAEMNYFGMGKPVDESAGMDAPAEEFPEDMQCIPNVRTYTSMVTLYGYDANLEGVSRIWSEMLERGVQPNLPTYTSLINALHKVALRKRWRRTKAFAEISSQQSIANASTVDMDGDCHIPGIPDGGHMSTPAEGAVRDRATKQDKMIAQLEDSLVASAGSDKLAMFDIPLGTLLLRYHSMKIHDTAHDIAAESGSLEQVNEETSDDIKRAMRVCLAVEEAGLQPDYRFHSALADLFDTCGDASGAELVRKHMGPLMDPRP